MELPALASTLSGGRNKHQALSYAQKSALPGTKKLLPKGNKRKVMPFNS